MENKIYQILKKHKLPLKKREELIKDLLPLFSVVCSTSKKADPKIKFNCGMCKTYYENNLNKNKVVNRCCPSCANVLPSI